jgi:hypothetical protein
MAVEVVHVVVDVNVEVDVVVTFNTVNVVKDKPEVPNKNRSLSDPCLLPVTGFVIPETITKNKRQQISRSILKKLSLVTVVLGK